jgi:hypothetical protein
VRRDKVEAAPHTLGRRSAYLDAVCDAAERRLSERRGPWDLQAAQMRRVKLQRRL